MADTSTEPKKERWQTCETAQPMSESERELYLNSGLGIAPYLQFKDDGMPVNPVNQVAWLLLQGSGCGFCKVCRPEPCGIKDGEKCTKNIANYIRKIVHDEDEQKSRQTEVK